MCRGFLSALVLFCSSLFAMLSLGRSIARLAGRLVTAINERIGVGCMGSGMDGRRKRSLCFP